ncbi:hypothetical protein M426DRAFT_15230 [Hypoxylon sp. CI-4A]|nr:hypothetical protein M426DRAFT_15230 [Hypoxylon sp. CI-4A]
MPLLRKFLSNEEDNDNLESNTSSSLLSVRESLSRSLSTRAQRLRRRTSSTTKPDNHLCKSCYFHIQNYLIIGFKGSNGKYGLIDAISYSGNRDAMCTLCQIFSQVLPSPNHGIELHAVPFLPHLYINGDPEFVYASSYPSRLPNRFLDALPSPSDPIRESKLVETLHKMISTQGLLFCFQGESPQKQLVMPRLVPPHFDSAVVKEWLQCCRTHHDKCRFTRSSQSTLNLIDCTTRKVISFLSAPGYIALSYVWGKNEDAAKFARGGSTLSQPLPNVVEDALKVTVALGYRYLWVDKYCIDQQDGAKKHEQIMHMDSVYQDAVLTIITAAGTDETFGLPGVSKARLGRQVFSKADDFTFMSTLPSPCDTITKSYWATRGWTYQEAILSRRRLVFTDDQLYFECNAMGCSESYQIPFNEYHEEPRVDLDGFIQPALFAFQLPQLSLQPDEKVENLSNFLNYLRCAEQYSKRTLSFDSDSLNAFGGIIRQFESIPTLPVRHIWGSPLFHPDDDILRADLTEMKFHDSPVTPFSKAPLSNYSNPTGKPSSSSKIDFLAYMMLGLAWRHSHSQTPPRRRNDFPSWSWAGWEGAVCWPWPSAESDIQVPNWLSTTIHLEGGSTQSIPDIYHISTHPNQLTQHNKSLRIETSIMSPAAFLLDESSHSLTLSNGAKVELYPSKQDLNAAKVFKRIQSGRYEVLSLVTVKNDAYLMLIKRYHRSTYRIGTLVVNTSLLTPSLFTSSIKTFKIR